MSKPTFQAAVFSFEGRIQLVGQAAQSKVKPLVQTPAACLLLLRIRSLKQTLVATRASCNSAAGPRETKSKIRNSGLQTSSNLFDPHSHWDLFASPYAPMAPCNPKNQAPQLRVRAWASKSFPDASGNHCHSLAAPVGYFQSLKLVS